MQFEKFEAWMIGQHVKEIRTGDEGIVIDSNWDKGVLVNWHTGNCQHINLDIGLNEVSFLKKEQSVSFKSITINGKRYKLVPIEEE